MLRFRRRDPNRETARLLHEAIVARARAADFYTRFGIPDTIDGRFDLLVLHAFLVMHVLKSKGEQGERVGTHLATMTFAALEDALRDLGVGDFGMGRRIKAMANAFYGRLEAYSAAADSEPALAAALMRNLYRGDDRRVIESERLARYALGALRSLRSLAEAGAAPTLLEGHAEFGPLPHPEYVR